MSSLSVFNAVFHSLRPQVALSWVKQLRAREDAFARQLLKTRLTASFRKGGGTCGWKIHGKCPGATFALEAVRQHAQSLLFTRCWRQQPNLHSRLGWLGGARSQRGRVAEQGTLAPKAPRHQRVTSVEPLSLQKLWGTGAKPIMPGVCNRKTDAWHRQHSCSPPHQEKVEVHPAAGPGWRKNRDSMKMVSCHGLSSHPTTAHAQW